MPRPSRCRRVCAEPRCRGFRPNAPLVPEASEASSSVQLFVEEFEAIRIIDFEKRTHEQCALQMQVSRTTATEIYERARAKIAEALVLGKPLEIAGGNYEVCGGKCARDCAGRCRWKYRQLREHIANQTEQLEGNFTMKIAIPVKNENIYQHFGMAAAFKVYTVENGEIVGTAVVETPGQGHGSKVGPLTEAGVDCVVCGGIGDGAVAGLTAAGIKLIAGISGNADEAARACVAETLESNPEAAAAVSQHRHRHQHGHGEGCGCGCGGHGHGQEDGSCGCGCHGEGKGEEKTCTCGHGEEGCCKHGDGHADVDGHCCGGHGEGHGHGCCGRGHGHGHGGCCGRHRGE